MKVEKVHIITPELITTDHLGLIAFSPDEVERSDYDRFDASLLALNSAGKTAAGYLIVALGYDGDPREIYEIPEAVVYVRGLFERCPHLLYFTPPEIDAVRPLYLCLIGVVVVSKVAGVAQLGVPDMVAARDVSARIVRDAQDYARQVGDLSAGRKIERVVASFGIYRP